MAMTVQEKGGIEDGSGIWGGAAAISQLPLQLFNGRRREGRPPRESSSELPLREGAACGLRLGGGGLEGSLYDVLCQNWFESILFEGGSDMSCLENAEPKYTIFGSNGHKNALFGGLAFLI